VSELLTERGLSVDASCIWRWVQAYASELSKRALTLPEPTNFIQAVLKGIGNREGAPGLVMPAYASSFSDAAAVRLAAYLRRTRTTS
jgi:cytochrome c553